MKQIVDFTLCRTIVFVMLWLDMSELEEVIRQLGPDSTVSDRKGVENLLCPERGAV